MTEQLNWNYEDFPHSVWADALVEVNEEIIKPQLVEFGRAKTGQQICVITFEDGSKLDIWLDSDFPKSHAHDYAIWARSPFHELTLSTCPQWRPRKCSRCQVAVELWRPLDEISVDLKFCECDDHKRLPVTPRARIVIRNTGYTQKRLGIGD